jgi:hypothetical protein
MGPFVRPLNIRQSAIMLNALAGYDLDEPTTFRQSEFRRRQGHKCGSVYVFAERTVGMTSLKQRLGQVRTQRKSSKCVQRGEPNFRVGISVSGFQRRLEWWSRFRTEQAPSLLASWPRSRQLVSQGSGPDMSGPGSEDYDGPGAILGPRKTEASRRWLLQERRRVCLARSGCMIIYLNS